MTTQPFTLNHDGGTLEEIIGLNTEEREAEFHKDNYGDVAMAVVLLSVLGGSHKGIGAVVASILSGILGREIGRPSDVTEYIIRTVEDRDARELIFKSLEFADTITHEIDPENALKEFIESLEKGVIKKPE